MKRKIIVTNIPAFYKIRLYNEVNKKVSLLVIFTDAIESDRNQDFVNGSIDFEYKILKGSIFKKVLSALALVNSEDYDELILGGWDQIVLWILALIFPKCKNSLFLESSYFESRLNGIRGFLKRLFIKRLSKIYASGKSQRTITDNLGFKGETLITKGVGVFNYIPQPPYKPKSEVSKFLYVGRFVDVKNLKFLISVFNELPQFSLYLAGFGDQEQELKDLSKNNIYFLGSIENKKLSAIYQQMDVFVLPSKVEPWGLVVEEALNNGIPVIVSDRVGCAEEIIDHSNGLIFHYNDKEALVAAIYKMTNIDFYNSLRKNISKINFDEIEQAQIACYF